MLGSGLVYWGSGLLDILGVVLWSLGIVLQALVGINRIWPQAVTEDYPEAAE